MAFQMFPGANNLPIQTPLASAGGFGQNISNWFQQNPALVYALASGLAGGKTMSQGLSQAFGNAAQASAYDKQTQGVEAKKKALNDWLKEREARGIVTSPATMAALQTNPDWASELFAQSIIPKPKAPPNVQKIYDEKSKQTRIMGFNDQSGAYDIDYGAAPPPSSLVNIDLGKRTVQEVQGDTLNVALGTDYDTATKVFDKATKQDLIAQEFGTWGEFAQSGDYQAASDSVKSIIQLFIYTTSGATATEEEVQRRMQVIMPTMTDKPERIAAKKQRLKFMVDAIKERQSRAKKSGLTGDGEIEVQVPEGIDPEDWKYLTPEEREQWGN